MSKKDRRAEARLRHANWCANQRQLEAEARFAREVLEAHFAAEAAKLRSARASSDLADREHRQHLDREAHRTPHRTHPEHKAHFRHEHLRQGRPRQSAKVVGGFGRLVMLSLLAGALGGNE